MKLIKCWIWICERCKKIVKLTPKNRQTFFFCDYAIAIRELAEMFLTKPETVTVSPVSSTAENVEQRVYFVEKLKKRNLLYNLIKMKIYQMSVFSRTNTVLIMWSKRYVNEIFQLKQYMEINLKMQTTC
jgi:superfamily II DNA/RNA helicase